MVLSKCKTECLNTIKTAADAGKSVIVVYSDMVKAFDGVPHRRLTNKINIVQFHRLRHFLYPEISDASKWFRLPPQASDLQRNPGHCTRPPAIPLAGKRYL